MECNIVTSPIGDNNPAIDYFDPIGVAELRRTLSASSPIAHHHTGLSDRPPLSITQDHLGHHDGDSQGRLNGQNVPAHSITAGSDETTVAPSEASNDGVERQDGQEVGFDFDEALRDYIIRRESAGIEPRRLGVLFEELEVIGLGASARHQPTLGSLFNPMEILRGIQSKRHPPLRSILSGFEGVVRPGEMLLVLGRPGAGCSTLLKTLTNQTDSFHAVNGDVAFSSLTPDLLASRFRGDVQYIPEDDLHFPTLTVEETIRFAARCRAPAGAARVPKGEPEEKAEEGQASENSKHIIGAHTREEYEKTVAEVYMTLFGLRHVRDSVVGDEKLRGVSGGEKKRVSIAEAMAARALVSAWDNSTRGLDSSTALSYLMALRVATTHLQRTTMVCLYQASDAMYALFDKVCLIYEGRMVYFGPSKEAKSYFEGMGWKARNRQSVPDFLVSVTDEEARIIKDANETVREDPGTKEFKAPDPRNDAHLEVIVESPRTPIHTGAGSDGKTTASTQPEDSVLRALSSVDGPGHMDVGSALSDIRPPIPKTPAEFATYYLCSDVARRNFQDMDAFRKECGLKPRCSAVQLRDCGNGVGGNGPEVVHDGAGASDESRGLGAHDIAPQLRAPDPFSTNASTFMTSMFARSTSRLSGGTRRFSMPLSIPLDHHAQEDDAASVSATSHYPPGSKHPQSQAYKQSALREHGKRARRGSPYVISIFLQLQAVMRRRVLIVKGDWVTQALTTGTFVIQAVIIGTVFVNTPETTGSYFSRGGVIFFALFLPALFTMSEIPSLFKQRPIVRRHERAAMYHPMIEALAMTIVDIPVTFITISIYSIVLYFVVGFQRSAGQFFIFFLFVFVTCLSMKAVFRALASAFAVEAPAQAIAGVMLLALSLYSGYQIPIPSMIGALRWISYINPIRYSFEGVIVNEFHTLDGQCSNLVPSGPGYDGISVDNQVCTTVGSVAGRATVDGNAFLSISFGYVYSHLWRNFGILLAFGIGFTLALLIFTEIQTTSARAGTDVVLFKSGSDAVVLKEAEAAVGDDEEKDVPAAGANGPGEPDHRRRAEERKALSAEQPKMTDIFSWSHIRYTIPVGRHEHRVLLDDVSGYVAPGKLTALMGASGAGKTTLLNVLAQRTDTGVVSGDRYVNGQSLPGDFQAQTGYCQQMDTHVPTTTVREALQFSARLRQPASVSTAEKDLYADKCLKMCGLEEFADAMVGTLGVEHKKRTTIGVELAAKPRLLLFLDEPTSGLDSQSAWAIVAFLRDLADNGQAILCTIHQPSAELFQVFDRLLLLQSGGKTVYFGDTGNNATTIINYFESNGARQCKPGENPAEYMLEVIGAGATAVSDRDWNKTWIKTEGAKGLEADLDKIHADGRQQSPVDTTLSSTHAASFAYQLKELTARQYVSYWRNPPYLMSKLTLNIIGGLFIGFTFFNAGDSQQDTQNKVFSIFMATVLSSPLAGQMHVPYINSRDIFEIRERSSRMYSWVTLVTAQILVEIPWNILGSTLFFFCWYWTVGFPGSRAGYTYLMFGVLFPCYFTTIALAVASMAPSAEIAGLLFNFLFSFVLTFNGVLQPFSHLGWWKWMYHLSPYTYLIEGLLGQAIGHRDMVCSENEIATVNPPPGNTCAQLFQDYITNNGGYLNNPDAASGCEFCSTRTTDEYLGRTFNIQYSHRWRDLGIFCAFIVFNTVAAYAFTYMFRVRSGSLLGSIRKRFPSRQ
ncbi:hypothetical protein PC9H_000075 [Pleurotus ostreatus]|uniref:ABC transporter domain-containing protein n=1 Tax=Pleurotus ostreatus TaxID=5322 RepID=A0A8H7A3G8_PLEOS|nr:uncharacterized protein PC9H_000075 [Pleurotus ostreatus]KAF7439739.1 hypothetical protein PC9H_000075 [Pleurotus ostreatus]KAJ8701106.1 ATP-binding cassette transporter snq2 [Pleurotus ostreatus]